MEIQSVKISGSGWVVNGDLFVPNTPDNRHAHMVLNWIAAGNIPEPELTPEEEAAIAAREAKEAEIEAARATIKGTQALKALVTKSPSEIETYLNNNVTDLASARTVLVQLALAVSFLARREFES